jgi:hypothetical protein
MKRATFYHAGCGVCASAEQALVSGLDRTRFAVEVVNVLADKERITEAERAGVKSLPALVIEGVPFHINFGANLADLK